MNVFVLNAGRSGSTAFTRACEHITNYTAGHESRRSIVGPGRLAYPDDHIEADNRLIWFAGRLQEAYGDRAMYVHLRRDIDETVASYVARYDVGLFRAYRRHILWRVPHESDPEPVARDFVSTVTSNIELYLRDKTRVMDFQLEDSSTAFPRFWRWIGAEGDLDAALAEFAKWHNASAGGTERRAATGMTP